MVEKIKRITCTRCGKSIDLRVLPNKDFDGIGRVEVFEKAKGWYERFNSHKEIDLCPECAAKSQALWEAFINEENIKGQKDSERIVVQTPAGNITAKQVPDTEYPGIIIELEGQDGRPGVIMEYDPEKKDVIIRVWGKEDPDGDPIYVVGIGDKEE